jgi:hypothetical protein
VLTRLPPKYLNSVSEIVDIGRILPNNSTIGYAHFVYHSRAVSTKTPDAVSSNSNESMNTVMTSNTINILMVTMLTFAHLIAGPPMFKVSLVEPARIDFPSDS